MTTSKPPSQPGNENPRAKIGDNSQTRDPIAGGVRSLAADEIAIWEPAEEQAHDCEQDGNMEALEAIESGLQRSPVPVRIRADGKYEAVAKAHVVNAVRTYNKMSPENFLPLEVRVYPSMTDEDAFRLLAQDVEHDHHPSSLARGRFFERAIKQFGGVEEAARACRVSKATVSKNLDVARCIPVIGEKVKVQRDICQRDATWLMQTVGRKANGSDAPDAKIRALLLERIKVLEVAPAKKVFATLRSALKANVEPKPRKGAFPIQIDNRSIGLVRASRSGKVTVELIGAGDIPLEDLLPHLGAALSRTRA